MRNVLRVRRRAENAVRSPLAVVDDDIPGPAPWCSPDVVVILHILRRCVVVSYVAGSIALSLAITIPPYAAGQYGYVLRSTHVGIDIKLSGVALLQLGSTGERMLVHQR